MILAPTHRANPAVVATGACLLLRVAAVDAQALPPVSPERLELAADRIEALTILGGDYSAAGGAYKFRSDGNYSLDVGKLGGGGDIGDPRPLGDSGLKWNPLVNGNIGDIKATGEAPGELAGNTFEIKTFGLQLGGGVRFWFNENFSVAPSLGGMYGHVSQTFNAYTDFGKLYLEPLQKAGYVDYSLDTWSVIPGVEAKYQWHIGRNELYVQSTYKYFYTDDFNNSSAISVGGSSQTWGNVLDADIPLGWTVFGHELHTGGQLTQLALFGNVRQGLDTAELYSANVRLVVDTKSSLKYLSWVGLGASYFWSGNLSGWSAGIDVRILIP